MITDYVVVRPRPDLGDGAHEENPLWEGRGLLVRHDHVGGAALGQGAEVHVHERLAPVGPLRDLDHLPLVGIIPEE